MAVLNFFDRPTDRGTDKASYRSSLPELKNQGQRYIGIVYVYFHAKFQNDVCGNTSNFDL